LENGFGKFRNKRKGKKLSPFSLSAQEHQLPSLLIRVPRERAGPA
jgi:hypothetical protein